MNKLRKLINWIRSPYDFRMERYLAGSADIAELDHRMRKWQYMSESERARY